MQRLGGRATFTSHIEGEKWATRTGLIGLLRQSAPQEIECAGGGISGTSKMNSMWISTIGADDGARTRGKAETGTTGTS